MGVLFQGKISPAESLNESAVEQLWSFSRMYTDPEHDPDHQGRIMFCIFRKLRCSGIKAQRKRGRRCKSNGVKMEKNVDNVWNLCLSRYTHISNQN